MGFLKPKVPAPPPPPPAPPPPPQEVVRPAQVTELERQMKDPKRVSRQRTIKTGTRGAGLLSPSTVKKPTLMGGS